MTSLVRAFALFTGASFIGTLTQIFKGKLAAVALGPEGVGVFTQIINLWAVFSVIASLGFYNGLVRHLADYFSRDNIRLARRYISSNTIFLMLFSIAIAIAGCVYSKYISKYIFGYTNDYSNLISIMLISVPLYTLYQIYRCIINSTGSAAVFVRAQIFADILGVPILCILIVTMGITGYAITYICSYIIYIMYFRNAVTAAAGKDMLYIKPMDYNWADVQCNLGYGVSAIAMSLIASISTLLVSNIIIESSGLESNGIYAVAMKVTTLYIGGFTAVSIGHYFPQVSASQTSVDINMKINSALRLYMYVLPPLICLLICGGDVAIEILFSNKFNSASVILLIVLPADLFRVVYETLAMPLLAKGKVVLNASIYLCYGISFVLISYLAIPKFGISGAAFAYMFSFMLAALMVSCIVWVILDFRMQRDCAVSIAFGLTLVFGSSCIRYFVENQGLGAILCGLLALAWFLVSLADPKFAAGARFVGDRCFVTMVRVRNTIYKLKSE